MKLASRAGVMAYGLAIAVITIDQIVKSWVVGGLGLAPGGSLAIWGPLRLTLVENRGISFGLFQSDAPWTRWALAAFSLGVSLALAIWVRRTEKAFSGLALGLIIGGAVGNLFDRVRNGAVVDFVDVQALYFPWIFNVADSAITIGIMLLMAESLISPRRRVA
jgi:signal peptidase II